MQRVKTNWLYTAQKVTFSRFGLRHLAVVLIIIITITLILLHTSAGWLYSEGYTDPFIAYESITPGQPTSALSQYPCVRPPTPSYLRAKPVCILYFDDGVFSKIVVSAAEDTIVGITFTGNGLELLDLVQRWGQPDYQWESYRGKGLRWNIGVDAFTATVEYIHNRSAITQVMIGCKPTSEGAVGCDNSGL